MVEPGSWQMHGQGAQIGFMAQGPVQPQPQGGGHQGGHGGGGGGEDGPGSCGHGEPALLAEVAP